MQQRRLRPGDIVEDYCPRERRVTDHAIVAMVDDGIKQTRCTTCDAEHEYKHGKMPALRRKKDAVSAAYKEVLAAVTSDPLLAPPHVAALPRPSAEEPPAPARAAAPAEAPAAADGGTAQPDAGRVHRRLIRATLPRLENQPVVRPIPEFTMHQPAGRGAKFRGGAPRGQFFGRPGSGPGGRAAGRSDVPRHGRGHQPPRHGKKHSK